MRSAPRDDQDLPRSSGLHAPPPPPDGCDASAVALHYLRFYSSEYARAREVVKLRAKRVVVWTAVANGLIAVLGTAVAVFDAAWMGLLSTALAASIGVLAAWDGLYRHREMWVQRSVILSQLQELARTVELRRAAGDDGEALARESMSELNTILAEDLESWTSLRRTQPIGEREAGSKEDVGKLPESDTSTGGRQFGQS